MTQTQNLTQGQHLMWLGQQLFPDAPLYNMIHSISLKGKVDVDAFQTAFSTLVHTSENLRTTFQLVNDEPQAIIVDDIANPLEWIDFSGELNPDLSYEAWLEKRRAQAIQLAQRSYDSALIKLADDHFIWYLNQHHIVTDATSAKHVYDLMSDLYAQAVSDTDIIVPEIPPYNEHVAYEQSIQGSKKVQKAQTYWEAELAKASEKLQFYGKQAANPSARTHRKTWKLDAEISQQLQSIALERGIRSFSHDLTHANIFAALILAFTQRITQQNALRLGLPYANRPSKEAQNTLGIFIEVLSMHVEIDPNETFRSLVKKVAAKNIDAIRNTQSGISSAEHNRAYEILLNFLTVKYDNFAGIPMEIRWVHSGYGDSRHQIRFQVHDMNQTGQYQIDFDFSVDNFSPADQDRALQHFERMMRACLADVDQPLQQISLLSDDEYQQHVFNFNNTDTPYPSEKTVIDLFEAQSQKSPETVAIIDGQQEVTFAQLNHAANHLANNLAKNGISAGDLVPICMTHSAELIVSILAIHKLGAAYVPLDPNYPDERLQFILDDIGNFPLLLTQSAQASRFDKSKKLTLGFADLDFSSTENVLSQASPDKTAYVIYTSGSTGKPKGVLVHHAGLTNYAYWAAKQYIAEDCTTFALYSSLAFDLTVTSIFVPLIAGGTIRCYVNDTAGMVIREVFTDDAVDVIKLTPSHLALMREMDLTQSRIKKLIVGGEDFKTELAQDIHRQSNGKIAIYNEYGPTEATVACMLHHYKPQSDIRKSVPIGTPSDNMRVYILDENLQASPVGVIGEMYLSGIGVANGYLNQSELTAERFLADPFADSRRIYKTGDIARWLSTGQLEFLGRRDAQVKVGGARIELGEIESKLLQHPAISEATVIVQKAETVEASEIEINYCDRCGLASDFPGVTFNADNICSICSSYDGYADKAQQYFMEFDELETLAERIKAKSTGEYDCISLLSGGKDSTYVLYHLVNMGLRVLTFTLDNGYISNEAKANIRRITDALGVDHVWGETPFMNSIFVDSLKRYTNVCNGCFKTIYTLAINIAREKGISTIVTGLSRGQFFETRLTEELFTGDDFNASKIDESIARARKAYHQRDDIISRSLDVDVFRDEELYQDIEFVDFYRYCDVDLEDLYAFLKEKGLWVRPSDTGRSTNCLINDVGIYLHKKKHGFHNYALPYSWDVRLGHKTREEALDELNDDIDEPYVKQVLREIGYTDAITEETGQDRLVAYYVADEQLSSTELRDFLTQNLPAYMIPTYFVALDAMPLTSNGKVNQSALPKVNQDRDMVATAYVAPASDVEETLAEIWQTVLNIPRIGTQDNFFDLGGHSLPAIRITSRIEAAYEMTMPIDIFFANPSIAQLAIAIEDILLSEIDELTDEEVLRLLAEDDD